MAQQMLRQAFTTQGARVMPYIEASAQAAGTDAADCNKLACAPALLREVGAELAVALNVVRANNAEPMVYVTLIDRQNYHLFQPLLYQVAMAGLSPADVAMPIRSVVRDHHNVQVLLGEVVAFAWRRGSYLGSAAVDCA